MGRFAKACPKIIALSRRAYKEDVPTDTNHAAETLLAEFGSLFATIRRQKRFLRPLFRSRQFFATRRLEFAAHVIGN